MTGVEDETGLRQALRARPRDPALWANLGRLLRARGADAEALSCYRRAAGLPQAPAAVFFNLGNALYASQSWEEAETAFLAAFARDPAMAAAALQAGRCAVRLGKWPDASERFAATLRRDPDNFSAALESGHLHRRNGEAEPALSAYRRAAAIAPGRWEGHVALARALEEGERFESAAASYHRAILAAGASAGQEPAGGASTVRDVHRLIAGYRMERGDFARALEAMRQALLAAEAERPAPDADAVAALNADLCLILIRLDLTDCVRPVLDRAVAATSENTLVRLAQRLADQGAWGEAVPFLRRNVALRPDSPGARRGLANALIKSCRFDEGLAELDRAAAAGSTEDATQLHAFVAAMTGDVERCLALYRSLGERDGPLSEYRSSAAMASLYSDGLAPSEVASLHRELFEPLAADARPRSGFPNARDSERRLRVGFVTPDLYGNHPVNQFLQPVLARLGRAARNTSGGDFALGVYNTGGRLDAQTVQARERVHHWVEASDLSVDGLARRIEADEIDILVDLSGHTTGNRAALFARRAAPVQVTFLGYPGSTGVPNMDWIIGDPVVTPQGADALYSEQVMRLPNTVFCFAPEAEHPFPALGAAALARAATFGSFNALPKLTPRTVRLWAAVLAAVPQARLLLKAESLADPAAVRLMRERFAAEGVDPARLDLRGPSSLNDLMATYGEIDVGLDPVPYNGGTTTHQALWMGVPVVCLAGGHFVSRMSASFMRAAGLDTFVAEDEAGYVAAARRAVADRVALLDLKRGLRARLKARPAWDADLYARDLGLALRECWRAWCR